MTVGPAKEESLDAALATAGPDLLALDLRKVPKTGPVADWFAVPRPARAIGAMFNPAHEKSFYATQRPAAGVRRAAVREEHDQRDPGLELRIRVGQAARQASTSGVRGEPRFRGRDPGAPGPRRIAEATASPSIRRRRRRGSAVRGSTARASAGLPCHSVTSCSGSAPVPTGAGRSRFTASVRAEVSGAHNQAQLWLRVDREKSERGFFDNMQDTAPSATRSGRRTRSSATSPRTPSLSTSAVSPGRGTGVGGQREGGGGRGGVTSTALGESAKARAVQRPIAG